MGRLLNVRVPPGTCIRLRAISTVVGLLPRDVVITAVTSYQDRLPAPVRRRVKRTLELRRKANI